MTSFSSNKISFGSETIAVQLRRARQAKKIKLAEVSKILRIKQDYLKALEDGNYEKLPVGVYGKTFLREYSQFLGLNFGEILEIYENEKLSKRVKDQPVFSSQVIKKRDLLIAPKIFKNIAVGLFLFIFLLYFGYYIKNITALPRLSVDNPTDNYITNEISVDVIGSTDPEVKVFINGESILSDASGMFQKKINLKKGINVINIEAKKKFGRSNFITRQILVKEK